MIINKKYKETIAAHAASIACLSKEEIVESMIWLLEELERPKINSKRVYEGFVKSSSSVPLVEVIFDSHAYLSKAEIRRMMGAQKAVSSLGHIFNIDSTINLAQDQILTVEFPNKTVIIRGV
jgi:hypothetical protein